MDVGVGDRDDAGLRGYCDAVVGRAEELPDE
jgi:hypothetical protein